MYNYKVLMLKKIVTILDFVHNAQVMYICIMHEIVFVMYMIYIVYYMCCM